MDFSASQYSEGGESGWTTYLEQSYVSKDDYGSDYYRFCGAKEEEDMSMVSDASSGPRYYEDDEYYCYKENGFYVPSSCSNDLAHKEEEGKKKKKNKERCGKNNQKYSSGLDDTASSPAQGFSNKNLSVSEDVLGFSQGFSATKLKGKSSLRKHFGFFKSSKHVSEEKEKKQRITNKSHLM